MIAYYKDNQSTRKCARYFKCSTGPIKNLLRIYGKLNKPIRYDYDENFFARDTEEAFYWAGFIAADGCIADQPNEKMSLRISLATTDKNHLVKFLTDIGSNYPIYDSVVRKENFKKEDLERGFKKDSLL